MCDANDSWKTTDGPAALSLKESMAHTTVLYFVFYSQGRQTMTFLVKACFKCFEYFNYFFLVVFDPLLWFRHLSLFLFFLYKKLYHYELPFTVQNMYAKNSVSLC